MQNLHKPTCIPANVASIIIEKSTNPRYSHKKCTSEASENVRFIGKTSIKVAEKRALGERFFFVVFLTLGQALGGHTSRAHTASPRPLARTHDTNTKRKRNRFPGLEEDFRVYSPPKPPIYIYICMVRLSTVIRLSA